MGLAGIEICFTSYLVKGSMLGSFSKYFDEAIFELTRFFLTNKEHHFFEAATEAQRNKFRLFARADIKIWNYSL
jgi:hypothetical protein